MAAIGISVKYVGSLNTLYATWPSIFLSHVTTLHYSSLQSHLFLFFLLLSFCHAPVSQCFSPTILHLFSSPSFALSFPYNLILNPFFYRILQSLPEMLDTVDIDCVVNILSKQVMLLTVLPIFQISVPVYVLYVSSLSRLLLLLSSHSFFLLLLLLCLCLFIALPLTNKISLPSLFPALPFLYPSFLSLPFHPFTLFTLSSYYPSSSLPLRLFHLLLLILFNHTTHPPSILSSRRLTLLNDQDWTLQDRGCTKQPLRSYVPLRTLLPPSWAHLTAKPGWAVYPINT